MLTLLLLAAVPSFPVELADAGTTTAQRLADIRCMGRAAMNDGGTTFTCVEHPGEDLTDALWKSERVVIGTVTSTRPRTTVEVRRTLKGKPRRDVVFDLEPSLRLHASQGERAVWLLIRGSKGLVLGQRVDATTPDIENYLATLAAESSCATTPQGACFTLGAQCFTESRDCACEMPCQGGAPPDPSQPRTASWVCRAKGCSEARVNARCSTEGLSCEGCWGHSPWRCSGGRWRYTDISPPP